MGGGDIFFLPTVGYAKEKTPTSAKVWLGSSAQYSTKKIALARYKVVFWCEAWHSPNAACTVLQKPIANPTRHP